VDEALSKLKAKYASKSPESPEEKKPLAELSNEDIAQRIAAGIADNKSLHSEWNRLVSDDWQRALSVLRILPTSAQWPADVWRVVLGHAVRWAMNSPLRRADLISILEIVEAAPADFISKVIDPLSQLLEFFPRVANFDEIEIYWPVWESTLSSALSESPSETVAEETLENAISTVAGRLTDALFEWIRQRSLAGKDDVPERFWSKLETVCNPSSTAGRGPRSLAAMHLMWLFSKNPDWTRVNLLTSFKWNCPEEAKAVWDSTLLFGPPIGPDLWPLLKKSFLDLFENTDKLSPEARRRLYQQFAQIVVRYPERIGETQSQQIVTRAPHEGRQQIAWVFWRVLESSDSASSLWRDRIGPWIETCWQPDKSLRDPETSENLTHMVLAANDAFTEAVDTIEYRLVPVDHPADLVYYISTSPTQAPHRFPGATVKLLDLVIDRNGQFYKGDLAKLLRTISENWPDAIQDKRFKQLSEFAAG